MDLEVYQHSLLFLVYITRNFYTSFNRIILKEDFNMLYLVFNEDDELIYRTRSFNNLQRNLLLYLNVGIEKNMFKDSSVIKINRITIESLED